jgi:hypothetical protein
MRLVSFLTLAAFAGFARLHAETAPAATHWERISVAPMKTSIYFGSVTLKTTVFVRHGSTLTTTYDAKVFPWFFWSESGRMVISLTDAELAHLAKGETAQFTGEGTNNRHKPRVVTGRAEPTDANSGKFKIRLKADGYELIFNGTYRFDG